MFEYLHHTCHYGPHEFSTTTFNGVWSYYRCQPLYLLHKHLLLGSLMLHNVIFPQSQRPTQILLDTTSMINWPNEEQTNLTFQKHLIGHQTHYWPSIMSTSTQHDGSVCNLKNCIEKECTSALISHARKTQIIYVNKWLLNTYKKMVKSIMGCPHGLPMRK